MGDRKTARSFLSREREGNKIYFLLWKTGRIIILCQHDSSAGRVPAVLAKLYLSIMREFNDYDFVGLHRPARARRAVGKQAMNAKRPLVVQQVARGSSAWKSGIRKGDRMLSANGKALGDEIDFRFETAQPLSRIKILRGDRMFTALFCRSDGAEAGLRFADTGIAQCSNHCVFCFIDQMPPGLRASLYVKDEDASHSFANGNYVTLACMSRRDLGRICRLGLSPLYVSVHATELRARRRMLGNKNIPGIMGQLRFLEKNGVRFHTQIVVCPGFNNGATLHRTVGDLLSFTKGLLSIAVVPVGLTRFHRKVLTPVDSDEARRICAAVAELGEKDLRRSGGMRRVFLADELWLTAGLSIPPRRYYQDYPQIENGVGLVRTLLEEWASLKRKFVRRGFALSSRVSRRDVLMVTSEAAYPFISRIAVELQGYSANPQIRAVAAQNRFFGGKVTVAGLLTARDVIRCVKKSGQAFGVVVLPAVMFNRSGCTLDGYSICRLEKALGTRVAAPASLNEMADLL